LVRDSEHLELCDSSGTGHDIARRCRELQPDVLILDETVTGDSAVRIARKLALERPLPTLLIVDEEDLERTEEERSLARTLRIYRLSRSRLESGQSVDLSYARTRLHLLASRAKEGKQTMSRADLQGVLDELLEEDADLAIGFEARELVAKPLNLIILAGGEGAAKHAAQVIRQVDRLMVPVLIALEEESSAIALLESTAQSRGIPFSRSTESAPIKRTTGILCATSERWVEVHGNTIVSMDGPSALDAGRVLGSAADGVDGLLVVLLPGASASARHVLSVLARRGIAAATSGGDVEVETTAILTETDLAWVLSHGVPRRV
jgi:hypothetical protein